jgi:hypothetical protein
MTALDKYARLEGPGVWRDGPDAQRRDVAVSLGDASLMIADARSGMMLSHWSLPAVQRLNRGTKPALYSPGPESDGETLELDDALLIEALETIRAALAPRAPLRRLRLALGTVAILATVAAVLWLPQILVDRTAAAVPPAMRAQIGRDALDSLTLSATAERICADPEGRQAMATLRGRVLGDGWRVSVVAGVPGLETAHLPGRLMILGQELVERLDSAEALAGWMLAEVLAAEAHDPLLDTLHYAGIRATFALMTTGALPEGALTGYAPRHFRQPSPMPSADAVGARLDALGQSPAAYAMSLPPRAHDLAEALADRPSIGSRDAPRLLSDGEWLTLQEICAN